MNNAEILEACRVSKEFFAENFYKIPVVGKGTTPFIMRDYQKSISNSIDENSLIIGLKARQIGWTTVGVFNALHNAMFNEEHPWLFVSRTEDAAMKMLAKAVYAYQRLPKWMRDMLPDASWTQQVMTFSNGSRIESVPATGSTGRGDSVYGALLDECAFMDYAEEIWGAVEPLVYGPAMLFSTANGMGNFFHEIWLDSERPDSVWRGIFYPWDVVPSRNQDWYDHTKRSFRGREWLFYQEYPSSPEEAFAKSGRVAFTRDLILENYEEIEPSRHLSWQIGADPVEVADPQDADIPVTIWREPEVLRDEGGRPLWKPNYVVAADVAEGLEHGDWTYVTVFDVNKGEQVVSSKSAIPVSYLDELVVELAHYYYKALVIIERNNAGILPIDRVYRDHWYPRIYRMDKFGEMHVTDRTPRYGWLTSPQTKPKMVNDFIYALSENRVILHDPDFLFEAQTFVANGKGGYEATEGNHDDTIMGTLIAYQGILDSPKYQILWEDPQIQAPTHADVDAIIFPKKAADNSQLLEKPIGRRDEGQKPKKSVVFTPANYGK